SFKDLGAYYSQSTFPPGLPCRPNPPQSVWFPTRAQYLRRLRFPLSRGESPAKSELQGLHPLPRHQRRLRQCLLLAPLLNPSPERGLCLPCSVDPLLPHQPPVPPHFSRRPKYFLSYFFGNPSGLSYLSFVICYLRFFPTFVYLNGDYVFLC